MDYDQARGRADDFGESARSENVDDASITHEGSSNSMSANPQLVPDHPFNRLAAPLIGLPDIPVDEPLSEPPDESPAAGPSAKPLDLQEPAEALPAYNTPTFPPGRDLPGFVPFGRKRQASSSQGNHWPIEPELRGQIVHAELDNFKHRPEHQRLTYGEILEKYDQWNPIEGVKGGVVASTLRGYNRRYTIPDKEHRVRRPQWNEQHLRALRKAVPRTMSRRGTVSWKTVRESVEAATGRPFGLATLSAKWRELKGKGRDAIDCTDSSDMDSEDGDNEDGTTRTRMIAGKAQMTNLV